MPTSQVVSICTALLLALGTLVAGPVSCSMNQEQNITKRVQAACAGDLGTDAARSSA